MSGSIGDRRLPAPHDGVKLDIWEDFYDYVRDGAAVPEERQLRLRYTGTAEELIAAGVVTREMTVQRADKSKRVDAHGDRYCIDRYYSAKGQKLRVLWFKPVSRARALPGASAYIEESIAICARRLAANLAEAANDPQKAAWLQHHGDLPAGWCAPPQSIEVHGERTLH